MAEFIQQLNLIGECWLNIMTQQSFHLAILFVLLYSINILFWKKSAVFLYSVWSLFLYKAVLLPVIRLPFLRQPVVPAIPMNAFRFETITALGTPSANSSVLISIPSMLFLFWVAGIFTMVFIYFRNERLFYSSLNHSATFKTPANFERLRQQNGIRKPVALRISTNVPAPFTKGFRKPVIYLPESALSWNNHQLNHVLCHELAHIRRNDILAISFQNVLNILYFFHPLVWLANHQINLQREKICDDAAIQILDENPASYGRTLIDNLQSFLVHRRLPLIANGLFFSKKTIIRRFEYLSNHGKEIKMKLGPAQKSIILLIGLFVLITACVNETEQNQTTSPTLSKQSELVVTPDTAKVKFVPYDSPPEPVGGFKAIQQNVIYPQFDQDAGHEGTVVVQAFIDENGNVSDKTTILISSGFEGLEKAAIDAIMKTKFKPAIREDKPVGVFISIPILFKLDSEKTE
ncbi:MAG TPA: M56 family peptidase [Candidatus Marinimicrobia bacterium]|nr:M56 family peptidase [Candidatus Neomarinimicrobiota bacterium]